jgi:KOW motif
MSIVTPGTTFDFLGERYQFVRNISGINAAVTRLSNGQEYRLKRTAPVTNIVAGDSSHEAWLASLPSQDMGSIVRIKSGKYEGQVGIVAKVNATTYMVAVPNSPTLLVSHALVEAAPNMISYSAQA